MVVYGYHVDYNFILHIKQTNLKNAIWNSLNSVSDTKSLHQQN